MQYFYTFEYPTGVEPFQIPQQLMQYQEPIIPEKRKTEKLEKNFVVLTEMKGKDGIINNFVPTLKDNLADKINDNFVVSTPVASYCSIKCLALINIC